MKERHILFSAPMVKAILDGTKTMTRREVKAQPSGADGCERQVAAWTSVFLPAGTEFFRWLLPAGVSAGFTSPYGQPGDHLWVREAHYRFGHWEPVEGARTKKGRTKWMFIPDSLAVRYERPKGVTVRGGRHHKDPETPAWHVRLGRFMPRALSRITLEVTSVRVERLHDITEEDAKAEGVEAAGRRWRNYMPEREASGITTAIMARHSFMTLWESINGPESWAANPHVWAISFRRVG